MSTWRDVSICFVHFNDSYYFWVCLRTNKDSSVVVFVGVKLWIVLGVYFAYICIFWIIFSIENHIETYTLYIFIIFLRKRGFGGEKEQKQSIFAKLGYCRDLGWSHNHIFFEAEATVAIATVPTYCYSARSSTVS